MVWEGGLVRMVGIKKAGERCGGMGLSLWVQEVFWGCRGCSFLFRFMGALFWIGLMKIGWIEWSFVGRMW